MFKHLCALSFAVPALADASEAIGAQCSGLIDAVALTPYSIMDVEGASDYSSNVSDDNMSGTTLVFNYCKYISGSSGVYGQYRTPDGNVDIATELINPLTDPKNIRDDDGNILGVKFTQGSDTTCADHSDLKYSMKTKILCKESVTGVATVKKVKYDDEDCEFEVTLEHDSGCPLKNIDVESYYGWLSENEWAIGIIYLVIGPLLAFFGLRWFPYVTAALVCVFIFGLVVAVGLAFGWMTSTVGLIIVLLVGILLGVLAGCLIRRKIWIMISLLGLIGGFFLGALVFALIASMTGWGAVWAWWVISILMAILGAFLAYKLGVPVILLTTSFVGSYLFTRAWTLFFPGHWPSEAQVMSDVGSIEVDAIFWVFVGIFALMFIVSFCVQRKSHK